MLTLAHENEFNLSAKGDLREMSYVTNTVGYNPIRLKETTAAVAVRESINF